MTICDIHTHRLASNAIVAVEPGTELCDGYIYSMGVHPWHIRETSDTDILERLCTDPRVVAIGECGLDRMIDAPLDVQERVFARHIEISETLGKPMIIHCVRAFDRLLAMHCNAAPRQPWIIHGFRQKPEFAAQLLEKGICLSLGPRFNAATAQIIPDDMLFIETDDDPHATIEDVARAVGDARNTTERQIFDITEKNASEKILKIY